MSRISSHPASPQFPPTKICTTCGRALEPPPVLRPGSKWAAAMTEYLILRREYQEADRQLGEAIHQRLEAAAPVAGGVR